MNTQKPIHLSLLYPALATILLLLIPLIAMQFTNEVKWGYMDFLIAGFLLFGAGSAFVIISRKSEKTMYKSAIGLALFSSLLLLWVNGAVGIIGNEGQSINLLYGLVLLAGIVGSFLSRLRSNGMSYTLFTMAIVQLLVPAFALFLSPPPETSWSPSVVGVFILSGFFAVLFVGSGFLFKKASNSPE